MCYARDGDGGCVHSAIDITESRSEGLLSVPESSYFQYFKSQKPESVGSDAACLYLKACNEKMRGI